jgi:cation diffusion facilitator CzcD-associated flavoprotein CzcO
MGAGGRVAIVGGGLAGFTTYVTLLHGGIEPEEITVFGTFLDPAAAWRRRAESIRQRRMRSESDGHCLPTSFPGLAVRAAGKGDTRALLASVCNRYHPSVDEFLEHVAELRERTGWDRRIRLVWVDRVRAADGGFALGGHGVFRHVLLAPGPPGLAVPEELAGDPRTVHAYEPHEYAERVAVVGAGMAAATEWLNALAAGARVVSVRRREPERRPLNVPRMLFSRRGLAGFQATEPEARAALLRRLLGPSYPPGPGWDEPVAAAAREGRFSVAREVNGEAQIVCATGFRQGFANDPLLARLVAEHGLAVYDRWIAVEPDCTVPELTDESRTLALAGAPAQWAYPAADTLVGAKYAARHFLRRVKACPTR